VNDYQKKLAEAPYHPGYEDAVVAESKPVLYGIYKSKPLTEEEIGQASAWQLKVILLRSPERLKRGTA